MDAFLFDTYDQYKHGGTGQTFDWRILKTLKSTNEVPIILSGGLNAQNVIEAVNELKPYAVDVNSGVEESPGKKDAKKMKDFIDIVSYISGAKVKEHIDGNFNEFEHLKIIIKLSGHAIRDFLAQANPTRYRGEALLAIKAFKANPRAFSDEKLVSYGKDTIQAINHPARIEVRGATKEGAAQMVAKGVWGFKRAQAARDITQKCRELNLGLHLKLAGTSSIEFNIDGVDKAVPIRFLQGAFEEVLKEMNYQPGVHINSFKTKTVIAADGDATVYDGPRVGHLPTLADSPVKDALCAYLQAGGVFMLVSGNDINRTFKRLVPALPPEVYGRVLIAANGGAELVYVNAKGQAVPVSTYRKHALEIIHAKSKRYHDLDMVYIGDDGSKEGNDYPGFRAVGFKHSVLVAREFLASYDPALKPCYVGGLLQGTRKYIEQFLSARIKTGGLHGQ